MTRTTFPLFAMLLVGCNAPVDDTFNTPLGIQIGDEGSFGCTIASIAAVADPDASIAELGMSANDAQKGHLGLFKGTATHDDGTLIDPLTVTLATPTAVNWVQTVGPDGKADASCPPYLSLTLVVDVDGGSALKATLPGEVVISAARSLLVGAVDMGTISTTFTPLWVNPADMAWTDFSVRGVLVDGDWEGGMGFMGCTSGNVCSPPVTMDGEAELVFGVAP